jgi:acetyl-CoA carboxylase carboxyltransferase component
MSTHLPVPSDPVERLHVAKARAEHGGAKKYHEKNSAEGKLFCRERLRLLFDEQAEFVEDGLLANQQASDLPADGVVTGIGRVLGRPVAVMANDSTVKAGSWGGAHRRKDHPHSGDCGAAADSADLPD